MTMETVGYLPVQDETFYTQLNTDYPYLSLDRLPLEWFLFIFNGKPYQEIRAKLNKINGHLESEQKTNGRDRPVCPELKNIWRWTDFSSPEKVKVVILGQDPYHQYKGERGSGKFSLAADGFGFSVDTDYFNRYFRHRWVPTSLKNITDLVCGPGKYLREGDGDLTSWYKQGVIMLDLSLTTVGGQANAHEYIGWDYVTKLVIEQLGKSTQPRRVFMFWRQDFECGFKDFVDKRHFAIFRCHPASLRSDDDGCSHRCWYPENNCFVEANKWLESVSEHPIHWNPLG